MTEAHPPQPDLHLEDVAHWHPIEGTPEKKRVAIGCSIGATIETYDFIGFGTAAALYFNNVFFKEFFGKYATHMTECTQRTGEKTMTPLHAAVELGARGQVLRVMVRPETKPTKCFADLVKRDTFSAPPSDHFWIPVTITFTEQ